MMEDLKIIIKKSKKTKVKTPKVPWNCVQKSQKGQFYSAHSTAVLDQSMILIIMDTHYTITYHA